ncbi:MAG: SDR family NAD(P)-dependent oxidoreductase [Phycisphaera sp.]|nr:SDR family NAD(P)-dependent oxidoreductase [Phycisphaera sp.]
MGFDVKGKVCLVTGANRGIGKAIVESLIAHGASKVYAAVRKPSSADELVKAHPGNVVAIECDVSKPATIDAAAIKASDVQLVVNNAGIFKAAEPFSEQMFKNYDDEVRTNVFGLLHMARAFGPVLKHNGGGAFAQLNSVGSLRSFPPFMSYCATKAAAYSFTQALREMWAEQGTQVLSVHPGPIKTDMGSDAGLDDIAEPASLVGEGLVAALKTGDFHLFPDTMAKQFGAAYENFATKIVTAKLMG